MEPNPLEAQPVQPAQPAQPVVLTSPKKDHALTIILSVLLIIATAIATLLYFQNQKLVKELASYQTQPTIAPSPIPTPDATANWKTYTDPKGKYSFKYPPDWTMSIDVGLFNDPSSKFILGVETHESSLGAEAWIKTVGCKTMISVTQTSGGCTESEQGPIVGSLQYTFVAHYGGMHTIIKNDNTIFDISLAAREPNPNFDEIKTVYSQILSTFRFLK